MCIPLMKTLQVGVVRWAVVLQLVLGFVLFPHFHSLFPPICFPSPTYILYVDIMNNPLT